MNIEDMVKTAVKALDSKKAVDIKVVKVEGLTTLTDYFIICNGTSTTQIKALADECEFRLSEAGVKVRQREGKGAGNWILLDYKDIIVNVYNKEAREHYDLERFWADGEEIDIAKYLED